jgi:hypothetical protein
MRVYTRTTNGNFYFRGLNIRSIEQPAPQTQKTNIIIIFFFFVSLLLLLLLLSLPRLFCWMNYLKMMMKDRQKDQKLKTGERTTRIEAIEESSIMMVPLATSTETIWFLILFLVLSLLPNSGSLGLNFVG